MRPRTPIDIAALHDWNRRNRRAMADYYERTHQIDTPEARRVASKKRWRDRQVTR